MQGQTVSEFSKCVGGPCPIQSECTRFTSQPEPPPTWTPYFLIIPYNQQTNSCEMKA